MPCYAASADTTAQLWQLAEVEVTGTSTRLQGKPVQAMQVLGQEVLVFNSHLRPTVFTNFMTFRPGYMLHSIEATCLSVRQRHLRCCFT